MSESGWKKVEPIDLEAIAKRAYEAYISGIPYANYADGQPKWEQLTSDVHMGWIAAVRKVVKELTLDDLIDNADQTG